MIDLSRDFKFKDIKLVNFTNLTDAEKELVRSLRNKESVKKWMYSDKTISKIEHLQFINKLKWDTRNFYWLAKHKNGEYLGVIYLNRLDEINKNAYLGIYVNPDSDFKGKGKILLEGLKLLGFEKAKLHTIKLEVLKNNKKAIAFYSKSGFISEGLLKDFVFRGGSWQDIVIMGVKNKHNG